MFKYDLAFAGVGFANSANSSLMNAAGSLGFAPDPRGPVDLSRLGAFVTNPVSLGSRSPAQGARYHPYPGGFLLHTGYPNPGLRAVLKRYAGRWAQGALQVLVHLLASQPEEVAAMVRLLEGLEGIAGIELGLPVALDAPSLRLLIEAAMGELPVVARLPFEQALELAPAAIAAGAAAVSLAPPRGALPTPGGALAHGRLYGPTLFPQALQTVRSLALKQVPVIGSGGVYSRPQAESMLSAGALAVQLDSVLWRGGWQGDYR